MIVIYLVILPGVFLTRLEDLRALLKLFRLELSTACWSREFHLSMTRSAKNFLRSSRQRCLANFRLWPLVRLFLLISNN